MIGVWQALKQAARSWLTVDTQHQQIMLRPAVAGAWRALQLRGQAHAVLQVVSILPTFTMPAISCLDILVTQDPTCTVSSHSAHVECWYSDFESPGLPGLDNMSHRPAEEE